VIIPAVYASRRNLARAYRRGYAAGTIADPGGVPLPPYVKGRMNVVFESGFAAAQLAKEGAVELTLIEVSPRERELLAMLESIHQQIAGVLRLP
jgi:hypothetical protein